MRKNSIVPLLGILLGTASIAVALVILAYRTHFNGPVLSDPAAWGQFGDYFGGTLNPILAFLSFTALVVTLAIQTRQLDISVRQLETSQAELEATRLELQRSADAQGATAVALTRQAEMAAVSARISALSVALGVLEREMAQYDGVAPQHSGYARRKQLQEQRASVLVELDQAVEWVRSAA